MVWGDFCQGTGIGRWMRCGMPLVGLVMFTALVPTTLFAAEEKVYAVIVGAAGEEEAQQLTISANLDADELIRVTAETVLADVRENRDRYAEDPSELYIKVREWVFPHFDFERISRYVLGNAWKEAPVEVQQQFADEFSVLMLHTYGSALLAFQDGEIEFLPYATKADATMTTVKTQVRSEDGSVSPVDYRLGNHTGQWKVLDVKIDGISMVKTYRSEYGAVVKRQGIDELIAAIAERNLRNL